MSQVMLVRLVSVSVLGTEAVANGPGGAVTLTVMVGTYEEQA